MEFRGKRQTTQRILKRLGDRAIRSLDLYDTVADDELLFELAERGKLESLDLSSDHFTDDGLQQVVRCCPLRSLMIRRAPLVTDRLLAGIDSCPTLRELYLEHTAVTDQAIGAVGQLPDLWSLSLSHSAITDAGLQSIASTSVNLVMFDECEITGTGCSTWSMADKMSIYTKNSPFNDAGLACASKVFPRLWSLLIPQTQVSDEGLRALAGQRPASMRIMGTRITRQGVLWLIDNVALESLEVDELSPRQALEKLYELKSQLG